MAVSWTVVMVLPSSGTLTFRRLDSEPLRCQNGTLSEGTEVSLKEVGDRPIDRADNFSAEATGLMDAVWFLDGDDDDGQSWYFDTPDCN